MKKIDKRDLNFYLIVAGFFVLFYLLCTNYGEYLFGSTVDWSSQHYKIPEYFRQMFYKTGDLLPDFAPNIGAGQNIYNFSYYGLLNPVILLSYLLPFVPMHTYIEISTLILMYSSVVLMYKWSLGRFSRKTAIFVSSLFALSAPLLFHAHRQIMFVNYMPFLIMCFMGVDRYFKQGKKILLPLGVFLVCMTSYFFSVVALFLLVFYGIYVYFETNESVTLKRIVIDGVKYALLLAVGVLMAAIILLPTFAALLEGRSGGGITAPIMKTLTTPMATRSLFYHHYGLGLTSISLFALIYGIIHTKREKRYLSIFLFASVFVFTRPLCYLLNAGMYMHAKVLIPFIPLCLFMLATSVEDMQAQGKMGKLSLIIFSLMGARYALFLNSSGKLLLLDFALTLVSLLIFNFWKKGKKILYINAVLITLLAFAMTNLEEVFVKSDLIEQDGRFDELIEYAIEGDKDYYRVSDKIGGIDVINRVVSSEHRVTGVYSSLSSLTYKHFFYDEIGNDIIQHCYGQMENPGNVLFDIYMGNKYVVTENPDKLGLEIIKEDNGAYLCAVTDALPVAYLSSEIMSSEQYSSLEYPYNVEALMRYVIVDDAEWRDYKTAITEVELGHRIVEQTGSVIQCLENGEFVVTVEESGRLVLELDEEIKGQLLFISLDIEQTNTSRTGDHQITINDITNTLTYKRSTYNNKNYTFEYTISESSLKLLDISFSPGVHKISNIKAFTVDYDSIVSGTDGVVPFEFDMEKTKGDVIEGAINADNDGYFTISIPYDRGFTVYVDGEKAEYEQVNTSFIGFKLSAGEHNIRIVYRAPLKTASIIISALAFIAFCGIAYRQTRKPKKTLRRKYEKKARNSRRRS